MIGAFSGAAFHHIGGAFTEASGFFAEGGFGRIFTHGVTGGITSVLSGGKFGHGFFSAGFSKLAMSNAGFNYNDTSTGAVIGRTVIAAVIGGTTSKISGGKFGNGAGTAAMAQLFNAESSNKRQLNQKNQERLNAQARPDEIAEIVDEAISLTTDEQFKSGKAGYNVDQSRRYVFLEGKGWVDLQHVVSAAYNPFSEFLIGDLPGLGVEIQQAYYGSDSAFMMEDFISNSIGARSAAISTLGLSSDSIGQITQNYIMTQSPLNHSETRKLFKP